MTSKGFPAGPYLVRHEHDPSPETPFTGSFVDLSYWIAGDAEPITQIVPAHVCLERAQGFAVFAARIEICARGGAYESAFRITWTWRPSWYRRQSPMGSTYWECASCDRKADYGYATPPPYDCELCAKEITK